MDENTLLDKHAELQLIELGGNNSTGSRALFDIYDKEMVKRDKAEEKINKGKAPVETNTDKLEATVKSFVKVRDITSEEYIQDTATVYEKQWFKVKTAYNNTVRRLVELVSKGEFHIVAFISGNHSVREAEVSE